MFKVNGPVYIFPPLPLPSLLAPSRPFLLSLFSPLTLFTVFHPDSSCILSQCASGSELVQMLHCLQNLSPYHMILLPHKVSPPKKFSLLCFFSLYLNSLIVFLAFSALKPCFYDPLLAKWLLQNSTWIIDRISLLLSHFSVGLMVSGLRSRTRVNGCIKRASPH